MRPTLLVAVAAGAPLGLAFAWGAFAHWTFPWPVFPIAVAIAVVGALIPAACTVRALRGWRRPKVPPAAVAGALGLLEVALAAALLGIARRQFVLTADPCAHCADVAALCIAVVIAAAAAGVAWWGTRDERGAAFAGLAAFVAVGGTVRWVQAGLVEGHPLFPVLLPLAFAGAVATAMPGRRKGLAPSD